MQTIKCGRIIDGKGEVIENATIRVGQDGNISAVEHGTQSGGDALDWSTFTVAPGLIDAHDHLGIDMGDEAAQAAEPLARHVTRSVINARRILQAGITTLRDVGEKGYIDVELRDTFARNDLWGPRLLVSGQFITRTGGHGWYFGDEVDGPDEVRKAVRKQIKHGVDLIKIMATGGMGTPGSVPTAPGFTREEIQAAIDEAHLHGRKVSAHIHGGPAARWSIDAGLDTLEHGVFLERSDLEAMLEKGTYLIVTWGIGHQVAISDDVPAFYREKALKGEESYDNVIRQAVELGVKIAVGGDTYHADMADELGALVRAGMSPMQALQAATRNGAEACGILDETGTIEVGKRADLVAFGRNPLDDIAAVADVRGVLKQGRLVPTGA